MTSPKVSIVILKWNGLEDTVECLESLKKLTYPNYEVIVTNDGAKGNGMQVLKEKFGGYVHPIQNDKDYWFSWGSNVGIRCAMNSYQPDYIFLNSLASFYRGVRDGLHGVAGAKT